MEESIQFVRLFPDSADGGCFNKSDPSSGAGAIPKGLGSSSSSSLDGESPTSHTKLIINDDSDAPLSTARDTHSLISDTADMAFFLKHTGPPVEKGKIFNDPKHEGKAKVSLTIFRRSRGRKGRSRSDDVLESEGNGTKQADASPNVAQRQTINGKRYLQILPSDPNGTNNRGTVPRVSVALSERTTTAPIDAFDTWIAELGCSRSFNALHTGDSARASSRLLSLSDDHFLSCRQCVMPETARATTLAGNMGMQQINESAESSRPLAPTSIDDMSGELRISGGQVSPITGAGATPSHDSVTGPESAHRSDSIDIGDASFYCQGVRDSKYFEPSIRPSSASSRRVLTRRTDREAKTRELKLRDLRSIRESPSSCAGDSIDVVEGTTRKARREIETSGYDTQSPLTPGTSHTPLSSFNMQSPTMLAADQFPPRGRRRSRPTRLILPVQTASQQLALAVRSGLLGFEQNGGVPMPVTLEVANRLREMNTPDSLQSSGTDALVFHAVTQTVAQKQRNILQDREDFALPLNSSPTLETKNPGFRADGRTSEAETIKKSQATVPPIGRRSSAFLNAFPLPPSQAPRASICSSLTSTSKEMRLEARVEALERENRLLEAALMAVLKTGGQLNGCPCGSGQKPVDAMGKRRSGRSVSVGAAGSERMANMAGDFGMSESLGDEASFQSRRQKRKSPLSVYLETRDHGANLPLGG